MKKILFTALLLFATITQAFTPAENATLKTAIMAEPTITNCVTNGDDICVTAWLNTVTTYVVWRTDVTQKEYQTREDLGTTFNWSGTGGFIARSQGERDAWRTMFASGSINPSRSNVITAFNDIFSGSGAGAIATRAHLLAISKRAATNAEKILSTGTGTSAIPGLLTYEGIVSPNAIAEIMGR